MPITFSIIIVSWNVRDYVVACLESLASQKDERIEVIVVDNNSHDSTRDSVARYPWVTLIALDENKGFARANNTGARNARGEFLVFLNPDTVAPRDFVRKLFAHKEKSPHVRFYGPGLLNPDGTLQRSVRRLPTVADQLFRMVRGPYIFPHARVWLWYRADDFDYTHEARVEQVMGACMVIGSEEFSRLNGFDERFFLWFEEVDLCRRARSAGIQVWYTPYVEMVHHGGRSFAQLGPSKEFLFSMSTVTYFLNAGRYVSALCVCVVIPISLCFAFLGQLHIKRG